MSQHDTIRGWKDTDAVTRPDNPAGELALTGHGGLAPSSEHASTLGCCGGFTNESTCGLCPTDFC
ncbi:hypothetical protein [Actinocatenispora comari]|jgi:hypothetical protein|uniref:Mersacidin/lichenicidin family type 2 lantibiotic n=1 Tax=Actinocatenispora comari TaxID=2807577 RepID=A0A8J4AIK6_9ACTN|nr:hypothetical protein [Actinocatenispora comari]GIL31873.1 hypothetical protein NUM_71270 [Actinocatenispora comari]